MEDERSRNAVEVAIRYGRNEATEEELKDAARAAAHPPHSYAAYGGNVVAHAAAHTPTYAYADNAARTADAIISKRLETANICREHLTETIKELF